MHAPEKPTNTSNEKPEPEIIRTKVEGVIAKDIETPELPGLKKMLDKNGMFFGQGGLFADGLYEMIEQELGSDEPSPNRRMGVWEHDKLIGIVCVCPSEHGNPNEVEISGGGEEDFARQGIAYAVADAVVTSELNRGHDVVAEVEPYNVPSQRLLRKLGFEASLRRNRDGRQIFIQEAWTEEKLRQRLGL